MTNQASIPPATQGPERIVVVDDDDARRRMFATILRKAGHPVTELPDGSVLIETVRREDPGLVLLDIMLPGKSGIDLTDALRADPTTAQIPIILVTAALDDEASIVKGLASGADDYIITPVGHGELVARIRVQLRHRRERALLHWAMKQRRQFKEESRRDPLTGIPNRRVGEERIEQALDHADALIVALLDIDHFKQVNDTYGHPVGDRVLVAVAEALEAAMPEGGIVARFGGEEFAAILAPSDGVEPAELGERLRRRVAALRFAPETGLERVTVSVGLTAWKGGGPPPDPNVLLEQADTALYSAKHSGRNRVVVASD